MIFLASIKTHMNNFVGVLVEADNSTSASSKAVRHVKQEYKADAVVDSITTALRQRKSRYAFPSSIL